jgi:hypothetical protein
MDLVKSGSYLTVDLVVVLGITTLVGLGGSFLVTGFTLAFIETRERGSPFFGIGGGGGTGAGLAAGAGAGLTGAAFTATGFVAVFEGAAGFTGAVFTGTGFLATTGVAFLATGFAGTAFLGAGF